MSIIIIAFPAAPKVDPEAVRKDEELNKTIKQKVTGKILVQYLCPINKFLEVLIQIIIFMELSFNVFDCVSSVQNNLFIF